MKGIYKKDEIPDDLQQYFVRAEIGLEETPEHFIAELVEVFRCVRDVLADDGTLWVNIGDSYAGSWGAQGRSGGNGDGKHGYNKSISATQIDAAPRKQSHTGNIRVEGVKPKDLYGIPWMLAFALRADGWYLRQDIIWHKPNPMPESVTDRCTKAHEYVFLLSKSPRYFYDHDAIKEPAVTSERDIQRARITGRGDQASSAAYLGSAQRDKSGGFPQADPDNPVRNKRSVWTVATKPYKGAHFAVFPSALVEPCILAGSRPGDVVLDPFMGSGTTAAVAIEHGRQFIGCELNPEYKPLQDQRIAEATIERKAATAQIDLFAAVA